MDYSIKGDKIEWLFSMIKDTILPSENNHYRSKLLQSNLLLYFVVLVLVLKITLTLVSLNILPQNGFFADITRATLQNSLNQTRQSLGLQPLVENAKLNQAAMAKAENMVKNQYFNHTSPSGITPWFWFKQVGYTYKYAGENLAIGFYESNEVYNAWLNSPSHKANIVSPYYTEVGTAILGGFGQDNAIIVVQEFASPLVAKATTSNVNSNKTIAKVETKTPSTPNTQTTEQKIETTNEKNITVPVTNQEMVLSETIKSTNFVESLTIKEKFSNLSLKIKNAILYEYDGILQRITFAISLIVMGILLTLILFNFKISFNRPLVFRAVIIIVLLSTATVINKEVIIALIPHQIYI